MEIHGVEVLHMLHAWPQYMKRVSLSPSPNSSCRMAKRGGHTAGSTSEDVSYLGAGTPAKENLPVMPKWARRAVLPLELSARSRISHLPLRRTADRRAPRRAAASSAGVALAHTIYIDRYHTVEIIPSGGREGKRMRCKEGGAGGARMVDRKAEPRQRTHRVLLARDSHDARLPGVLFQHGARRLDLGKLGHPLDPMGHEGTCFPPGGLHA